MLDEAARVRFLQSGWVVLKEFVGSVERTRLCSWADSIEDCKGQSWLRYYEASLDGRRVLSRIENFIDESLLLSFLLETSSALMGLVCMMLESDAVLFKDKINLKPPGGGAFKVHQDGPAYRGFGITKFVTAMIAIDEATVANGCLEFACGERIKRDLELDESGQIIERELEGILFEAIPLSCGDLVLFDGLVPHRSAVNSSDSSRRALFLTFNSRQEGDKRIAYYRSKREMFPPEGERRPGVDYHQYGKQFNLGNPFV